MNDDPAPASPIPNEEFRALILSELGSLHRLSRHLCDHDSEADDLMQESLLRALNASDQFELRPGGIRPWLFRIMYNTYRNMRRDRPSERLFEDFENDPKCVAPSGGSGHDVASLDWEQMDQEVHAAVQQLGDDYRVIFLLFAVEQMKYREIGEVLGIPLGTVMSRLARARKRLIELLPHHRPTGARRVGANSPEPSEVGASDE